MFAVIETGGKQYKVEENDILEIEKLEIEEGKKVTFDRVLLTSDGKTIKTGTPTLDGVTVEGEVLQQKKSDKVLVFKKKRRHNYRRKLGHRQQLTLVKITSLGGSTKAKKAPAKTDAKKTETKKAAPKKAATK